MGAMAAIVPINFEQGGYLAPIGLIKYPCSKELFQQPLIEIPNDAPDEYDVGTYDDILFICQFRLAKTILPSN